jgi:NADH:ubiquinone oxidoreductase subunit E
MPVKKSKETVFDDDPPVPEKVITDPLTQDLNEEDKAKFARLLKKKMSLTKRAELLVGLAQLNDRHGAPVALRAIEQINKLTGVQEDKPTEVAPMFQLPPNTAVAVKVFEPEE